MYSVCGFFLNELSHVLQREGEGGEGGREGGRGEREREREREKSPHSFQIKHLFHLNEISHVLCVHTGSSVLYFNTHPTSVFQITHI